jgi:phosphotriesterase-related protein
MTVRGPVDPESLGPTLMHEHVFIDLSAKYRRPAEPELAQLADSPMSVDLVGEVTKTPLGSCRDNLVLDDESLALAELEAFTSHGGAALVDCTVVGLGPQPTRLRRVSELTGLSIVLGTGIYVERAHPTWVAGARVEEIASLFVSDLLHGFGDSGVRAGIIGEIGTSGIASGQWEKSGPMTRREEKVLRAAGAAAVVTGAAVSVHLDPNSSGAFDVIQVLASEGVPSDRMIMCHMDAVPDLEYHLEVAQRGVYVEYDHFGRRYGEQDCHLRFATDAPRLAFLSALVEAGHEERLLVSQDVCMKTDLRAFGGVGYGHIMRLRDDFRRAGITDRQLSLMLVENPRRVLSLPSTLDVDVEGHRRSRPAALSKQR